MLVLAGGHLVSGVLSLDILPLPVPAQPAGGPALHLAGEGHQLLARAGVGDVTNSQSVQLGAVHILRKHILGSPNTLGGVVSTW